MGDKRAAWPTVTGWVLAGVCVVCTAASIVLIVLDAPQSIRLIPSGLGFAAVLGILVALLMRRARAKDPNAPNGPG